MKVFHVTQCLEVPLKEPDVVRSSDLLIQFNSTGSCQLQAFN